MPIFYKFPHQAAVALDMEVREDTVIAQIVIHPQQKHGITKRMKLRTIDRGSSVYLKKRQTIGENGVDLAKNTTLCVLFGEKPSLRREREQQKRAIDGLIRRQVQKQLRQAGGSTSSGVVDEIARAVAAELGQ